MKRKIKIIIVLGAVFLAFWTWSIVSFFSNNNIVSPILLKITIRSPIEPIIRTPVSDVTPTPFKNKRKAGTGAVLAKERLPTYPEDSIKEKIIKTFPEEPAIMLAVTEAESGFRNEASSWCCHGIMQIHEEVHKDKIPDEFNQTRESRIAWLRDPDNNLKIGKILYNKGDGKWHWAAYTDESYLKFLHKYL